MEFEIGDVVDCTECNKVFTIQIDSACFDNEDCRCQSCVNEWEKRVGVEIISAHTHPII